MAAEIAQTQNSILRISDEKTLQLLELYKKEECLWNTYIDTYKSRDKRQKAADRIAKALNVKYFEARHVLIKFKNLRNSYCQELKKIATSVGMGLRDDEVYKPKVFWFSLMDSFLRPHLQPARCTVPPSIPPEPFPEQLIREELEARTIIKAEIPDEDSSDSNQHHAEDYCESIHSDDFTPQPQSSSSRAKGKKRTRQSDHSVPSSPKRPREDVSQAVRDLTSKIDGLVNEKKEDYFDSFGRYVASLLRSIPKERAMMLQPQVISLIVSATEVGEGSVSQSDDM